MAAAAKLHHVVEHVRQKITTEVTKKQREILDALDMCA
jgi:hypothetical protein